MHNCSFFRGKKGIKSSSVNHVVKAGTNTSIATRNGNTYKHSTAQPKSSAPCSPNAKKVTIVIGTKIAGVPCDRAMSSISTAVAKEEYFMVPTRPRRSSEQSHNATKEAGGKGQEVRGWENHSPQALLTVVPLGQWIRHLSTLPARLPSERACVCYQWFLGLRAL